MKVEKLRLILCSAVFATVVFPATLYAYIDPVSGSMLLQAIVAAIVGIGVGARLYWTRLQRLFSRRGREDSLADKQDHKK
jgi:hypothetical protein